MTKNVLKALAASLWLGVAVASATPADATAFSRNLADAGFVTCGGNYSSTINEMCGGSFSYNQNMRFVTVACNGGACGGSGATLVEYLYSPGRKTAEQLALCGEGSLWGLGSCSC